MLSAKKEILKNFLKRDPRQRRLLVVGNFKRFSAKKINTAKTAESASCCCSRILKILNTKRLFLSANDFKSVVEVLQISLAQLVANIKLEQQETFWGDTIADMLSITLLQISIQGLYWWYKALLHEMIFPSISHIIYLSKPSNDSWPFRKRAASAGDDSDLESDSLFWKMQQCCTQGGQINQYLLEYVTFPRQLLFFLALHLGPLCLRDDLLPPIISEKKMNSIFLLSQPFQNGAHISRRRLRSSKSLWLISTHLQSVKKLLQLHVKLLDKNYLFLRRFFSPPHYVVT